MNKYILSAIAALGLGMNVNAQSAYDAETMTNSDLNGTARYVGMGGALGALGADLSTMSGNPAGTGLMRTSDVSFTFGGQFTGNAGALGFDAGRASLDQAGILFALGGADGGSLRAFNFGVNYQKKRNFLSNLNTPVALNGGSQTFQLAEMANYSDYYIYNGNVDSYEDFNPLVYGTAAPDLEYDGLLNNEYDMDEDMYSFYGTPASDANYQRSVHGSNAQVDFNLSANFNDQLFLGLSVGLYSMVYDRQTAYYECGTDGVDYTVNNWYHNSADGVDLKLGVILRPIESSPFRIGLTIHTPIWYHLRDYNSLSIYSGIVDYDFDSNEFEYNFRTPWKFGFSLGHTIGNFLAFGLEYELQDYSSCKYSHNNYNYYQFDETNASIKENLQTQHTLKLGMEVKPTDAFALRFGYNYISSPFKADAWNYLDCYSTFTETDYTNWKAINRITFGFGYRFKGGYFDMAYQYQMQDGDFYAYDYDGVNHAYVGAGADLKIAPTKITNNRSQIIATLGFKF